MRNIYISYNPTFFAYMTCPNNPQTIKINETFFCLLNNTKTRQKKSNKEEIAKITERESLKHPISEIYNK